MLFTAFFLILSEEMKVHEPGGGDQADESGTEQSRENGEPLGAEDGNFHDDADARGDEQEAHVRDQEAGDGFDAGGMLLESKAAGKGQDDGEQSQTDHGAGQGQMGQATGDFTDQDAGEKEE